MKVGALHFGKRPPLADIHEDKLEVHQPKKEAAGVKAVMVAKAVAEEATMREPWPVVNAGCSPSWR